MSRLMLVAGLLSLATLGWLADAHAQDASRTGALIRDLESADFDRAYAAVERLRQLPGERRRIVPALLQAMTTRDWARCSADMRDAIARTLSTFQAREAVVPLLVLVKSGKAIDHECFE